MPNGHRGSRSRAIHRVRRRGGNFVARRRRGRAPAFRWRCLPGIFALVTLLRIAPASAREITTIGDVVVSATIRAPATSGCPSEKELLESVHRSLERPPNQHGPAVVDLVIEVGADGATGTVRTTGREEPQPSHGTRTTRAPSCAHLAEALVLIVVQTLNPISEEIGEARVGESGDGIDGHVDPPPSPLEPGRASPGAARSLTATRPQPFAPAPTPHLRLNFGATAGAIATSGVLPSVALGPHFGLWAGVARSHGSQADLRGSRRLELGVTTLLPSDLGVQVGIVRFRALRQQLAACPTSFGPMRLQVFPCISLGALWIEADGRGFASNISTGSLVPFAGLAVVSRVRLTNAVGIRLSTEAAAHFRSAEWSVLPIGVVHRLAPLALSLTLAFESVRH